MRWMRAGGSIITWVALCGLGLGAVAPWAWFAYSVAFSGLLIMSIVDWRTRLVPPELSRAWMLAGIAVSVWRFVQTRVADPLLVSLGYGVGIYLIWQFGVLGGGDAKLLIGAFGLWPDPDLASFIVVITFLYSGGALLWRHRIKILQPAVWLTEVTWMPATWSFALAIVLYWAIEGRW